MEGSCQRHLILVVETLQTGTLFELFEHPLSGLKCHRSVERVVPHQLCHTVAPGPASTLILPIWLSCELHPDKVELVTQLWIKNVVHNKSVITPSHTR